MLYFCLTCEQSVLQGCNGSEAAPFYCRVPQLWWPAKPHKRRAIGIHIPIAINSVHTCMEESRTLLAQNRNRKSLSFVPQQMNSHSWLPATMRLHLGLHTEMADFPNFHCLCTNASTQNTSNWSTPTTTWVRSYQLEAEIVHAK